MKKCPTCSKEFPESMRFCQTDGTPLLDIVETPQNDDPYKTTVGKPEDFASLIPPDDPFKTVVGNVPKDESGDLLQLPEEHDPLKTSYIPEAQLRKELNLDAPKQEEQQDVFPPLPSPEDFAEPKREETPVFNIPEPPKFNEPSLSPPPLGWASTNESTSSGEEKVSTDEPDYSEPPTLISEPFKFDEPKTPVNEPPKFDAPKENAFNSPFNTAIPSPFDDAKPTKFEAPSTPLPSFKEPETTANEPFTPMPFGQQNAADNQPVKQTDWTPPPVPDANWQNQNIDSNTPFQPPPAGVGGENKTLAIVSLALGILSIPCCGFIVIGIAAAITGFIAKKKIDENPNEYGGRGMAMAGLIIGSITTVIGLVLTILQIFFGVLGSMGNF